MTKLDIIKSGTYFSMPSKVSLNLCKSCSTGSNKLDSIKHILYNNREVFLHNFAHAHTQNGYYQQKVYKLSTKCM